MSLVAAAAERLVKHSLIKENTRDTTPASPAYNVLPHMPGSFLQVTVNQEISEIALGDRQDGEVIGGTITSGGSLKVPMVKEAAVQTLIESAIGGTFGSLVTSGSITGTWAASGKTFTRAAGDFTAAAYNAILKVGDKVACAGTASQGTTLNVGGTLASNATSITVSSTANFPSSGAILIESEWISYTSKDSTHFLGCTRGAFDTTAATHADTTAVSPVKTIASITQTVLTFNEACVNESSVATTFTANRKQCVAGTARTFFTLEQQFTDLNSGSGLFEIFSGQEVNTLQATIPTSGQATFDINLVGMSIATSQVASSTYTAVVGNAPMAGSVTGTKLLVNGSAPSTCVETMQINLNNYRAPKFGVGSRYACLVEQGKFDAEAQFTAYFVDGTQRDAIIAGTRFALEIWVRDQKSGHGFNFVFPRMSYRSDQKSASGQTVAEQLTAYAERDATVGSKMYVELYIGA